MLGAAAGGAAVDNGPRVDMGRPDELAADRERERALADTGGSEGAGGLGAAAPAVAVKG